MKKAVKLTALAVITLFVAACGGSSDSSSDTATFSTIDQLPKTTAPVVSATTGNVATPLKSVLKAATTGMKLGTLSSSSFNSDSSRAACEMANNTKEVFNAGAQVDMIECYVGETFLASSQAINIYDGNYHVLALNPPSDDQESPKHIKMKISKTGGTITYFEMFACTDDKASGGTQKEYVKKEITGDSVSVTALGHYNDNGNSGSHSVTATGTVNTDRNFTAKTLIIKNKNAQSSNSFWAEGTYGQGAEEYTFQGYQYSNFEQNGTTGNNRQKVYSHGQLINAALLDNVALGDGAVYAYLTNEWNGQTWAPSTNPFAEGWNGDTTVLDNTISWVTEVQTDGPAIIAALTPKASYDELDISFDATQTYDCGETEEATIDIPSGLNAEDKCGKYQLSYDWINCYDIIDRQQETTSFAGTYTDNGSSNCQGTSGLSVVVSGSSSPYTTDSAEIGSLTINNDNTCSASGGTTTISSCSYTGNGGTGTVFTLVVDAGAGQTCNVVIAK